MGVGCIKPLIPVADLTDVADILDPAYLASLLGTDDADQVMLVPPDERRQYVDRAQYKARFDTGAQPDAHGDPPMGVSVCHSRGLRRLWGWVRLALYVP